MLGALFSTLSLWFGWFVIGTFVGFWLLVAIYSLSRWISRLVWNYWTSRKVFVLPSGRRVTLHGYEEPAKKLGRIAELEMQLALPDAEPRGW